VGVLILFALAIFSSAALLFLVQPMAAKMALPIFGGSPAVWNTSMLFFQAALLLGYLYAHLTTRYLKPLAQVIVHAIFAGAAFMALPLAMPSGDVSTWSQTPITSMLRFLAIAVGVPFLFTSTAGPLLQRWFSTTGHRQAADPYFLYAASNAGSLLGLLAYPFLIEPSIKLSAQGRLWGQGFVLMALLALACGVVSWRARGAAQLTPASPVIDARPVTARRRLSWILLAFVPSSLMIGVTQHISTDVAAVPLLWVIPLTLYLLTFIVAFSNTVRIPSRIYARIAPFVCVPLMMAFLTQAREPVIPLAAIHVLGFFVLALMCHKRLAEDRPEPSRLTEFFLLISVGGVLGGIFNSLIAPVTFNRVYEYPLVLGLALLLRNDAPVWKGSTNMGVVWRWAAGPFAVLGALFVGIMLLIFKDKLNPPLQQVLGVSIDGKIGRSIFIAGLPTLVCFLFSRWVVSFGLAFTFALIVIMAGLARGRDVSLHTERTFFGVYDVIRASTGLAHFLDHGTTRHGAQALDRPNAKERASLKPLTYYYPSGPIGDTMDFIAGNEKAKNYAFVGLGVGSLAAYGQPGEVFDFYEIDPAVERIARNPDYFTYLRDSDAKVNVIIGDARLKIAQAPDNHYGLIVVDAFSSDAIPTHLLTVEALELYKSKLIEDGIIAIHVSNRFFDLIPLVGGLADKTGMRAAFKQDRNLTQVEELNGKFISVWVVVARKGRYIFPLVEKAGWSPWPPNTSDVVWTDDYSSIRGVMR
jgi:predicted membrane-bound spermidine synthase